MFRYRLHSPDGDDLGEATYAERIKIGEELHFGGRKRFHVLDVVIFEEGETNGDSSSSANGTTSSTRKRWPAPRWISSPGRITTA